MLKISNYLFSILTAFQYLSKAFYEQFILKKLEFEPLFTELQERFKLLHSNEILEQLKKGSANTLKDLRQ